MTSTDTRANVTPGLWTAQRAAAERPGRASAWWASGYLAISGLLLAFTGHGALAVGHLALLGVLAWSAADGGTLRRAVFSFAPALIVMVLAYGEVPIFVAALGIPFHDPAIQRWDAAIFGMEPSRALAAQVPNVLVSELLHAGYLSYYLTLTVPPLLLYARRDAAGFDETVLTLVVTWVVASVLFVVFPVQGPRFLFPAPAGIPDGPFRRLSLGILAAGSARGTAFPSLHMAASLSQTVMAWRWQRPWLRYAMTAVTCLIGLGAVYAGYHYAVDILAGALLGAATTAAVILGRRGRGAAAARA